MSEKYVVLRGGVRVSETVYDSPDQAKEEFQMNERILKKYPDGTKVTIEKVKIRD